MLNDVVVGIFVVSVEVSVVTVVFGVETEVGLEVEDDVGFVVEGKLVDVLSVVGFGASVVVESVAVLVVDSVVVCGVDVDSVGLDEEDVGGIVVDGTEVDDISVVEFGPSVVIFMLKQPIKSIFML